eukprot:TRINITY_DN14346_c0_g1_i1.p1 TRINITY_DN14346_c0_g1~~TRINITY_DN14346_c0_g1_i1.p1  ORF type:complete len:606 (-),score=146.20 TRINITY_DN14346_c0_g1_i1:15-1832(-)
MQRAQGMDVPADLASLSPQELMRIFQDTTRTLTPATDPSPAQYRTALLVSALLAEHDSTTASTRTEQTWLAQLFAHLHHRALLTTLTAYHVTALLPLLVAQVWSDSSELYLAALDELVRTHFTHVQFATQCRALIQQQLAAGLPNLEHLVRYKHVTALIVIGLLQQYRTQRSLNHVLAAHTWSLLRQYVVDEISPSEHVTLTALAADMAQEFISLSRDVPLDSALHWLLSLFLEQPPVTCLITCWTRDHWALYCPLGAFIRQQRARDHPVCELFRASVHHVLLTRAAENQDLVPLVSSHVTALVQHDVLDLEHVTAVLALLEALHGHEAQRKVVDSVTRGTAECHNVSSVKFTALVDQLGLRDRNNDHVVSVSHLTRVKHEQITAMLQSSGKLAEFEVKSIFSSLMSELMFGPQNFHEQTASLLVGLITKSSSLQAWMEIEFFSHVTPSHLPRPSTDQYRESLPKKSPFEYDQHVIQLLTHRPRLFKVLAALASTSLATPSKEFLTSALAVLTGLWHSLSHPNSTQQGKLEHVTGDLIACLQNAGLLPPLPLLLMALSKLSCSEVTSLLQTMWLYLVDNDRPKITAKFNLLIMDNPRLCALSILE